MAKLVELNEIAEQIKNREKKLRDLTEEESQLNKELVLLETQLLDLNIHKTLEYNKVKKDNKRLKTKLESSKKLLSKWMGQEKLESDFLDSLGLELGSNNANNPENTTNQNGENEEESLMITVRFKGILENGNCKLFFSDWDLPDSFTVTYAYPPFKEFAQLAIEANESNNFPYLITMAHKYFLQHAEMIKLRKQGNNTISSTTV